MFLFFPFPRNNNFMQSLFMISHFSLNAFLPHIILPGVHVTPSMLLTSLEQAVATFILYMRIWGLQKAAPARKWRARMPIQIPEVPKPILSPLYLQEGLKSTPNVCISP